MCLVAVVAFLKEISADAVFVQDTVGTTDICQGQLGKWKKRNYIGSYKALLKNDLAPRRN